MSDSDFDDFEEPEEPEIIEDQLQSIQNQNESTTNTPEVIDDQEDKKEEKIDIKDEEKINKDQKDNDNVTNKPQDTDIKDDKSIEKKDNEAKSNDNKEIDLDDKKEIIKTPQKKNNIKNLSSAQKPNSTFHPISQDSDNNLNSKLSESFSMVTNETKGDEKSAIDSKTVCLNLISPNNQKFNEVQNNSKETKSLNNKKIDIENVEENKKISKKKKKIPDFPLINNSMKNSKEKGKFDYQTESNKAQKVIEQYNQIKLEKRDKKKSLLSKLKKLKIYRKLVIMKEEIQNNSCKEMKGLNKAESELLNEFLDSLVVLPESVTKNLFEI